VYAIAHTRRVSASLTLRDLQDRAAIHDLVMRYARAVDRRDFPGVAACFTPDAAYEGQLSRAGVADALARLEAGLARWDVTQHLMANQLIELQGDAASCETYALAAHVRGEGATRHELTVAVVYHDDLVRRGDGWLIAKRVARTLFVRETAP
jgi:ketosteroid isomerase-like protein